MVGPARRDFDARCPGGLDQSHDDDKRRVQRSRRRGLRQRAQPPLRHLRRGRREVSEVKMEHDEKSSKVDTGKRDQSLSPTRQVQIAVRGSRRPPNHATLGLARPSLVMRVSSVVGRRPSCSAAPPAPRMRQRARSSTLRMCSL